MALSSLPDNGAMYHAVSPASRNYRNSSRAIPLLGSRGGLEGFQLPPGVRFQCGPRVLSRRPRHGVDLSEFALSHRLAITGIPGLSALRRSIVTLDYREALVRIERKRSCTLS